MPFELLQTLDTKYCADSVEWCPITPHCDYFVCGTYELQESKEDSKTTNSTRVGQLHLLSITKQLEIELHFTADTSAILDIKWYPKAIHDKIVLATCNADGKVALWEFINDKQSLKCLSEYCVNNEDILSLSIDWATLDTPKLCVSDSRGFLTILCLDEGKSFQLERKLKVNDYEAWIATFSLSNDSILITGGDDCLLKMIDLRINPATVLRQDEHSSGVTSLRFNHKNENILASGSYDETIKLWDYRHMEKSLSSCEIGGGIWRIKWDPFNAESILTAAMYSGIYELKYSSDHTLKIIYEFKEHQSIAYGADYCNIVPHELKTNYLENNDKYINSIGMLTITCSFYDKKMCLCIL